MTICSVLAEGMLVTPIGYLIGEFGFQALVYAIFVINAAMFGALAYTNKFMERDSAEKR